MYAYRFFGFRQKCLSVSLKTQEQKIVYNLLIKSGSVLGSLLAKTTPNFNYKSNYCKLTLFVLTLSFHYKRKVLEIPFYDIERRRLALFCFDGAYIARKIQKR